MDFNQTNGGGQTEEQLSTRAHSSASTAWISQVEIASFPGLLANTSGAMLTDRETDSCLRKVTELLRGLRVHYCSNTTKMLEFSHCR